MIYLNITANLIHKILKCRIPTYAQCATIVMVLNNCGIFIGVVWEMDPPYLVSYLLLIYNLVMSMISELPPSFRETECLVT